MQVPVIVDGKVAIGFAGMLPCEVAFLFSAEADR
jgi:hypothetical protein